MILAKKNIPLQITQEEFAYAMGFIVDSHFETDYTAQVIKDQFPNKQYVGHQVAGGKFFFEDKNMSGKLRLKYSAIISYEAENIALKYVQLRLILKPVWFIASLISLTTFNVLPYTVLEPTLFKYFAPFVTTLVVISGLMFTLLSFQVAKKEIRTQIETRLRIREYHRQQER